ncbi:TPA: tyrosine-type recombinase/integrase, partial [Enterobacter roggenkampii]
MSRINKQLNASNSNIYTPVFVESILKVNIPVSIYLKSADHFDDKYISSTSDSWVFDYSGSRCYAHFRQDKISNQLIKYICFHYASAKCPAQVPGVLHAWSLATDHCISKSAFTFTVLKDYLETQEIKPQYFYFIIFGLKILCTEAFPGFTLEDYEDLEFIPRPHSHDWGIYQEIDHVLDPLEKNMISKGLFEMAVAIRYGENYSLNTMRDAVILGLTYVTGARPVQLAKLAVKDLRIDTRNSETGLIRYSLLLPYAKQRHVTTERLFLAIPAEIGALIRHYIERAQLKPDGKLFEFSNSAPFNVSRAINKAFLCFSPPDYQAAVKRGEAALPTITPTDLRHNVGHSLAMQGVSAEEIAHILGHSSLTVAKYYILATPALALIRAKALGINPVWQNMVAMMLTGELTSSTKWQDQRVVGIIGDELHDGIG